MRRRRCHTWYGPGCETAAVSGDRGGSSADTSATSGARSSARVAKPQRRPRASDDGRSRLGDLTRPIAVDRRITRRRRSTALFGLIALAIAGAIAAALFVLPVQTYFAQDESLETRQGQLDQLLAVNSELEAEVNRLRTEAGIREAAREEIGFAESGEQRLSLLPIPDLPTDLPSGWPYDLVTDVIALRAAPPTPATADVTTRSGPESTPDPPSD